MKDGRPAITLGVMQPYFFPYLGYFQLMHAVDRFILYDLVAYIRHGWVSRNRILEVNRGPRYIYVPLHGASPSQRIADVCVDERTPWRRVLLETLCCNYRRAPYFEETYPVIEAGLGAARDRLAAINAATITAVAGHLGLMTTIVTDTDAYQPLEEALAAGVFEDVTARQHARVVQVCQQERATHYVNAIGGQVLYAKALLAQHGITLSFVRTLPYTYPQRAESFVPHLSIIDVLMHCGRTGTRALLDQYELV